MFNTFQISRRTFLRRCSLGAAATGLPLWFIERDLAEAAESAGLTAASPDARPGIALIGCGGKGAGDLQEAARFGNVVALCDVDENHLNAFARQYGRNGPAPAIYSDFRKLLERADVHVVINATPDHWHSLINIAAAKAKKDVYGEKPLTLDLAEGRQVIKAVRDNQVVFQTGTQQRSDRRFRLACELVRNGRIGRLQQVNVWVPAGLRAGPFPRASVPRGLNWDFWLGQAPRVRYLPQRCHEQFRWWWDYAGGPVTDWGAHHNDIVRWGIGLDGPTDVEAKVLVGPIPGGYTTCAQFEAALMWPNGVRHVVKTTTADNYSGIAIDRRGQRNGIRFEGADGWIWVNRASIAASNEDIINTQLPDDAIHLPVSNNHMANFFDCVRSRKDPIATVEDGHLAAAIGHLIIVSLRQGRKFHWDPQKEEFVGDGAKIGNAHLGRKMRKPYDYSFVG